MFNPPNITNYWREYPHKVLQSYDQERAKFGAVSDSRYAHTMIAAGRPIFQDEEIIDQSIKDNSFYRKRTLIDCFNYARDNNSNIHLIGLVSDVTLHSSTNHLKALLEMAYRQRFYNVYIDLITDGIDTDPRQSIKLIQGIQAKINELGIGRISSVAGRNFAMTTDHNQIHRYLEMLISGKAEKSESVEKAILRQYENGANDSNIAPTLIHMEDRYQLLQNFDCLLFFNYRSFPIRNLVKSIKNAANAGLTIPTGNLIVTLTKYSEKFENSVLFERDAISDNLPALLSKFMKTSLLVTDTYKKYHLTYFFNGLRKEMLGGQEQMIIEKTIPKNKYNPKLNGPMIVRKVLEAIKSQKYDFIAINIPNADVLGHLNDLKIAGQTVIAVDDFAKQIVQATLNANGAIIITSDHGNIEQLGINRDIKTNKTIHTLNPVPFILLTNDNKKNLIQGALGNSFSTLSKIVTAKNTLADIAPTVLELMELPKPTIMSGHSLLKSLE